MAPPTNVNSWLNSWLSSLSWLFAAPAVFNNNNQPQFSYTLSKLTVPMSNFDTPEIDTSLALFPKQSTSSIVYQQNFSFLTSSKFSIFTKIFTDGSKSSSGVGSAAVCGDKISVASLPKFVTIFTAEVYAIWLALSLVRDLASTRFLVGILLLLISQGFNPLFLVVRWRGLRGWPGRGPEPEERQRRQEVRHFGRPVPQVAHTKCRWMVTASEDVLGVVG